MSVVFGMEDEILQAIFISFVTLLWLCFYPHNTRKTSRSHCCGMTCVCDAWNSHNRAKPFTKITKHTCSSRLSSRIRESISRACEKKQGCWKTCFCSKIQKKCFENKWENKETWWCKCLEMKVVSRDGRVGKKSPEVSKMKYGQRTNQTTFLFVFLHKNMSPPSWVDSSGLFDPSPSLITNTAVLLINQVGQVLNQCFKTCVLNINFLKPPKLWVYGVPIWNASIC